MHLLSAHMIFNILWNISKTKFTLETKLKYANHLKKSDLDKSHCHHVEH